MGRRKGRRSETEKDYEILSANIVEEGEESDGDGEGNGNGNGNGKFFACYLLTSLSPRFKGHCYIGFTVNPRRRIRQHNGEITSGATRTKKRRPWEMVLCIYGFSTNVAALQFEWAWQHPVESLAVRQAAATFKSFSGIANKIKLAYTMLNLPSWRSLNLTVNYFSTKYMKHMANCPSLPEQMKVQVCTIDELPRYIGGSSCVEQDDELLDAADEDCEQSGESQESMENRSADAQTLKDVILVQDDVEHSRAEQGGGCRKRTFWEQLNNSPLGEKLCKRSFQLNRNPVTEPSLSFSSCNKITANALGILDSPDELLRQPKNLGIGEKEVHKQSFQLNACPVRAPSMPVSGCNNMATIAEDNEIFCLPDELLRQPKSLGVVENGIRKQSFQPNGFPVRAPSLSVFSCNKEATNSEDGGIFGLPNEYTDEYDHMGKQQIPENTVPNKDQCPSTSSEEEVVVIDVFTPSPYFKANKRGKKPRFSEAEIIDLTNSPLFV